MNNGLSYIVINSKVVQVGNCHANAGFCVSVGNASANYDKDFVNGVIRHIRT